MKINGRHNSKNTSVKTDKATLDTRRSFSLPYGLKLGNIS